MRLVKFACIIVATAALSGCLQSNTLVKVNIDGTGTIEQTVVISPNAMDMMSAMGQIGDQKSGAQPADQFFNEATFRDAAARLGPGVRFVSTQPVTVDGMKGMKAIYAFDDVSRVRVTQGPSMPGMGASEAEPSKQPPVTFQLKKQAGGAALTITMPEPDKNAAANAAEGKEMPSQMPPEAMGMMQMLLKGMKVNLGVQVSGKILKTNAAHHTDTTVTLLEVDMDTLMQDPAMVQALQGKLRPGVSPQEIQAVLAGVKGVKMSGPTVIIEWR